MEYVDKFEGISYSALTEEQFDSLSEFELINKTLKEDVDQVLKYNDKYEFMKKNLNGSIILAVVSILSFGFWGLFGLIPVYFFHKMVKKRKENVVWCIKIVKMSVAVLSICNEKTLQYNYIFDRELARLDEFNLGEPYEPFTSETK